MTISTAKKKKGGKGRKRRRRLAVFGSRLMRWEKGKRGEKKRNGRRGPDSQSYTTRLWEKRRKEKKEKRGERKRADQPNALTLFYLSLHRLSCRGTTEIRGKEKKGEKWREKGRKTICGRRSFPFSFCDVEHMKKKEKKKKEEINDHVLSFSSPKKEKKEERKKKKKGAISNRSPSVFSSLFISLISGTGCHKGGKKKKKEKKKKKKYYRPFNLIFHSRYLLGRDGHQKRRGKRGREKRGERTARPINHDVRSSNSLSYTSFQERKS